MLDGLPAVAQVAILLCVPIWTVTELADELLRRASLGMLDTETPYKERWWGWFILRALPPLVGVACVSTPTLWAWLREDVLGLSALPLTVGRAIGYGVVAGIAAQAAHAWGLRPAVEALFKRYVLKLPTAVLLLALTFGCSAAVWPSKCHLTELDRDVPAAGLKSGVKVQSCQCDSLEWLIVGGHDVVPLCDGVPLPIVARGQKVVMP